MMRQPLSTDLDVSIDSAAEDMRFLPRPLVDNRDAVTWRENLVGLVIAAALVGGLVFFT